ncbi:MAG: family glycosyltransferase [Marmoricola sp.]|nr:family glycosyltransferase [Marmoricola sp.]
MRIALLTYSTRPRGGVVHTLALAEALARRGEEVHVWTLGRGGDTTFFRPVDPVVAIHAVPFAHRDGESVGDRILRSIATLGDAFDPAGYDVVHAQDCISANAALPCVRTVHHLDVFTTPELAACHERAVVAPHALVCVSEAVAAEVRQGWGRNPTVIANGVDAQRFAAGAADTAGRGAWSDRLGRYVLAMGGIEPRKGSLDLLEAMARVQRDRPDVRLVYAGGETLFDYRDYRTAFDARARELGVDLEVLGVVEEEALPALVAQASALGFVSTKEGFGLAAMEALAAGVPVVARDLPVLREVFGDTVTWADDVASTAVGLAAVLDGHRPAASAGRALAASCSWDQAAAEHVAFYERLP